VTSIAISERAAADLDRLVAFLMSEHPAAAGATVGIILDAIAILDAHPQIGRPVEPGMHELLISRGKTGYVAIYEFDEAADQVIIHAVRHQREAGYEA
jgi:plasmid stabilization system protein ParE